MNPQYMNQALSQLGSSYRVSPQQAQAQATANVGAVQQIAAQRDAEEKARTAAAGQKSWGLINAAANLYTGGAFGAVTGGVGKKEGGGVAIGNLGGGGGGGGGALGIASGIAGAAGGGGGAEAGAGGGAGEGRVLLNAEEGIYGRTTSLGDGRRVIVDDGSLERAFATNGAKSGQPTIYNSSGGMNTDPYITGINQKYGFDQFGQKGLASRYSQYELGNRTGGPIFGGGK